MRVGNCGGREIEYGLILRPAPLSRTLLRLAMALNLCIVFRELLLELLGLCDNLKL